jgi:hypothetical protein
MWPARDVLGEPPALPIIAATCDERRRTDPMHVQLTVHLGRPARPQQIHHPSARIQVNQLIPFGTPPSG